MGSGVWKDSNILRELRLQEMSKPDNLTRVKLWGHNEQIMCHLYKMYYIKDNGLKNHWIKEIYSFLHDIPKRKASNKYPSKEFIYNETYGDIEDITDNLIKVFKDEVKWDYDVDIEEKEGDKEAIFNIFREYFDWISGNLSTDGEVTITEVFEKINGIEGLN